MNLWFRVTSRVLSRFLAFGAIGALSLASCAFFCGIFSGGILGALTVSGGFTLSGFISGAFNPLVIIAVPIGAAIGAMVAVIVGGITGFFVLGIAGATSAKYAELNDLKLQRDLMSVASAGGALGTLCGMISVPCAVYLADLAYSSMTKHSLNPPWFAIYIVGVISGFIVGVIACTIWEVQRAKTSLRFKG